MLYRLPTISYLQNRISDAAAILDSLERELTEVHESTSHWGYRGRAYGRALLTKRLKRLQEHRTALFG